MPRASLGWRGLKRAGLLALLVALAVGLLIIVRLRLSIAELTAKARAHDARQAADAREEEEKKRDAITIVHYSHEEGMAAALEKVHRANSPLDACPLLEMCFVGPTSVFKDRKACHKNMRYILEQLDSSAAIQNGRVVGFISFHVAAAVNRPRDVAISTYNVCVHPDARGKGLAHRLHDEGIAHAISTYSLQAESRGGKRARILLALDVDMASAMAPQAFAMYARMGYLRAWQPCESIGAVDWRPLFDEDGPFEAVHTPLDQILLAPQRYVQDVLRDGLPASSTASAAPDAVGNMRLLVNTQDRDRLARNAHYKPPKVQDHYCMFKFYGDSWLTMGELLREPFRSHAPSFRI